jgi:hypothetical protein
VQCVRYLLRGFYCCARCTVPPAARMWTAVRCAMCTVGTSCGKDMCRCVMFTVPSAAMSCIWCKVYSTACYENVDCGVVCPVGTSFCEVMDCCARCTVPSAATLEMATVPPAKETNFCDEYRTSC